MASMHLFSIVRCPTATSWPILGQCSLDGQFISGKSV